MEEKIIKQIKTQCLFPLLIYKTNIKYNEVRKASGIAYILLELIEKSVDSNERISDVLLKFGIPTDLHYIFGKELAGLLGTEIIKSVYETTHFSNPKYFSQIQVGEVSLTEKGRKMFREGAIPTGEERVKQKDIYFDPVRRKYDVASSVPYTDISSTCLDDAFIQSIEIDLSGMEDYINANPTQMGLKAEERIVSFETEEPQWKVSRVEDGLTIIIKENGVEFLHSTSDENVFFNKYYSSEIMKGIMLLKAKYKFYDENKNPMQVPTVNYADLNVANIYIPDDIAKQAARSCKIFIGKNRFNYSRADNVIKTEGSISARLLDLIDDNAEFALLDNSGCKYYSALNVAMPCQQFGDTFEINLLVESETSEEQFNAVINVLFEIYRAKEWSDECGKVIIYIAEALHNPELFDEYTEEKLKGLKTADDKIEVLLKLNQIFKKSNDWKSYFMRFAEKLYQESVSEVRLDNTIYKNTVLSPLKSAMNMSQTDYIISFSESMKQNEDPTLVYQALEAAGFGVEQILGVVNVVELYMQAVLDDDNIQTDTNISVKFNAVRINLWKLNGMLGIKDLSDYTLREDYNVEEFFNAYSTYIQSVKTIERYKQYATKEYSELKRYTDIYEPIHDLLSIERTSSSHPEKITAKYIDEQITRGKYKDVICDLLVKLQYDLRGLLHADTTVQANELIDEAKGKGYIDGKNANALHKLRMCRNGFQHPESSRQIPFDKTTITEWKEIVFSINGEDK